MTTTAKHFFLYGGQCVPGVIMEAMIICEIGPSHAEKLLHPVIKLVFLWDNNCLERLDMQKICMLFRLV